MLFVVRALLLLKTKIPVLYWVILFFLTVPSAISKPGISAIKIQSITITLF